MAITTTTHHVLLPHHTMCHYHNTPCVTTTTHHYRRINQIDINNLKTDIVKSQLITYPKLSAESLYKQFHNTLSSILNTHAPLYRKRPVLETHALHVFGQSKYWS